MTDRKTRKKNKNLEAASNRNILKIFAILCLCCVLVLANILYLMTAKKHLWSGHSALDSAIANSLRQQTMPGKRGTIYDRNRTVLAQEEPAYTLAARIDPRSEDEKKQEQEEQEQNNASRIASADPDQVEAVKAAIAEEEKEQSERYVTDAKAFAQNVASVLGEAADADSIEDIVKSAMENGLSQTELGTGTKRVDKSVKEALEAKNIPGLFFMDATRRDYPASPFSSNMLGFAAYNEDTQKIAGVMGLEASMDSYLSGVDGLKRYQATKDNIALPGTTQILKESQDGDNVILTLDANLQQIVEDQMQQTMLENNASAAWCLVMEVETGRILAWASYPTYDQNTHLEIPSYTDNISQMVYEPGSVMKPFVYATAIDTGVYPYNAVYRAGDFTYTEDSAGNIVRLTSGSLTDYPVIRDAGGTDWGTLTFADGLAHSSNIAICELLANYVNKQDFDRYLKSFGFFTPTDIPFVPENSGTENISEASSYLSSGFGQASSVTALQLCQAYSAIFNDGVMVQPFIVDSIEDAKTGEVIQKFETESPGTPISAATANQVKDMLRNVFETGMSGEKFAMDNVTLTGKTGTGEIYNAELGTYDPINYTSSIMAAAPAEDPKIMVYWGMVSANYLNYSAEPFKQIMQAALNANSINGGTSTSTTSEYEKWETYTMPSLVNHSLAYCEEQMADKKVNTVILGDGTNIIDQFPKPGTVINSNDNVLLLSDGSISVMPDMIGWTRKDLTAFWQLTGIAIQSSGYGKAVYQSVEPGTPLSADMEIQVNLE